MSDIEPLKPISFIRRYPLSSSQRSLIMAIRKAFANFMRDGITGTAASGMAYYFIFSIFPLSLLIAVTVGHLVGPIFAQEEISHALGLFLPHDAVKLIHDNLGFVLGKEQGFGIAAVIGLTWSSLGCLAEVTRVLDNVFNVPVPRSFIQQRLIAIMMVFVLIVMIGFLFVTLGILRLITVLTIDHDIFWIWVTLRLMPVGMNLLILSLCLHNIPNCDVDWNAVWPAAIVGAIGWEGVRYGLSWYVGHGPRYSMIYGSISVIIVLLIWAYLTALVFLLSAELAARLNDWIQEENFQL